MDKEVLENHKTYLERKKLHQGFGYDVDKERDFILEEAKPFLGKILEAGTGKGHFALALAKDGYSFVTFDISAEEQRFAKLNLAYFGFEKQVIFKIENAEHTSFADRSFDVILCVNTLHHLNNAYKVIDEFLRILAPCGKLVLADFTEEGFKVMDKVHACDGTIHQVCKTTLEDVAAYLNKKLFLVKNSRSAYQHVLIARQDAMLDL
jgi:ubiquinone/menaquinone biosynthesis C-methylase UbiE